VRSRLRQAWAHHRFLLMSFVLAIAVLLFFTVRAAVFFVYWADPAHRNQPLEGWMTPRYIAHSYDLQVEDVASLLQLEASPDFRPTLQKIAKARGVPLDDLISELNAALTKAVGNRP
jgi:hypothetical protein